MADLTRAGHGPSCFHGVAAVSSTTGLPGVAQKATRHRGAIV
jgi:hypothetical protein